MTTLALGRNGTRMEQQRVRPVTHVVLKVLSPPVKATLPRSNGFDHYRKGNATMSDDGLAPRETSV